MSRGKALGSLRRPSLPGRAEFLFIGWEELTQFTYAQWDFLKGSNRCPIKTYWHKGCEYAVRPRMAAGTNPNGLLPTQKIPYKTTNFGRSWRRNSPRKEFWTRTPTP